MKSDIEHIMKLIIKNKQESIQPTTSLNYRLNLLRLTFKIEELLENIIKNSLKQKKILEDDFKKNFINEEEYKNFKNYYKNNKKNKSYIWNENKDGIIFFNVQNFIVSNTFGGLIKFIKIIKYDLIKSEIKNIHSNLEFKIFRKWMTYIKNIRNTLVHRTNIDPSNFLEKIPMPAQSKNLKTNELSTANFKRKIFSLFILKVRRDPKTQKILKKYNLIM